MWFAYIEDQTSKLSTLCISFQNHEYILGVLIHTTAWHWQWGVIEHWSVVLKNWLYIPWLCLAQHQDVVNMMVAVEVQCSCFYHRNLCILWTLKMTPLGWFSVPFRPQESGVPLNGYFSFSKHTKTLFCHKLFFFHLQLARASFECNNCSPLFACDYEFSNFVFFHHFHLPYQCHKAM